jgi:L-alanine-DL-glutamate epimerase-like enolase superfamily enzyme
VIGKDATAVEGIWNDLWKRTVTYNRGGIVTMAMSALDIALWDAIGKRANMPLHRLWGHVPQGACRCTARAASAAPAATA